MKSLLCIIPLALLMAACGPTVNPSNADGGGDQPDADPAGCIDGVQRCNGNALETCANDEFVLTEQCANACDNSLGCVFCQPYTGTCNGDVSTQCLPDGSGYQEVLCDSVQGQSCNTSSGVCDGACALQNLGQSYIGCEYYPTVTGQIVSNSFPFAVAIANTSSAPATITIDEGALGSPMAFDVAPGAVAVQPLPWVQSLKLCNGSGPFGCSGTPSFNTVLQGKGAYHLRSTQPVTVYQFSPLDYTDGAGTFTYTNDASLLLPTNVLTGNYRVAAWPFWSDFGFPGMIAVTATQDQTQVTITPRAASGGSPSFPANTPTTVTLDRGDVVQLVNLSGDFTGSEVLADKRVQVIGGHYCTNVPLNVVACDHLEESMFPVETLSTDYIVTAPALPSLPNGKEQMIRIIATASDTLLTYDPPLAGAPTTIANAGDFVEIPRQQGDFFVSATSKILVSHYMEGQDAGGGTGDPAMTLAVATDQYRTDYLFHAPTNYEVNYVNITAPLGTTVMLDGTPIADFAPIGNSGFGVARVQLTAGLAGDGNHNASSDEPFGITVYGYGQYTSYYYPGGLDLAEIPIE